MASFLQRNNSQTDTNPLPDTTWDNHFNPEEDMFESSVPLLKVLPQKRFH